MIEIRTHGETIDMPLSHLAHDLKSIKTLPDLWSFPNGNQTARTVVQLLPSDPEGDPVSFSPSANVQESRLKVETLTELDYANRMQILTLVHQAQGVFCIIQLNQALREEAKIGKGDISIEKQRVSFQRYEILDIKVRDAIQFAHGEDYRTAYCTLLAFSECAIAVPSEILTRLYARGMEVS